MDLFGRRAGLHVGLPRLEGFHKEPWVVESLSYMPRAGDVRGDRAEASAHMSPWSCHSMVHPPAGGLQDMDSAGERWATWCLDPSPCCAIAPLLVINNKLCAFFIQMVWVWVFLGALPSFPLSPPWPATILENILTCPLLWELMISPFSSSNVYINSCSNLTPIYMLSYQHSSLRKGALGTCFTDMGCYRWM